MINGDGSKSFKTDDIPHFGGEMGELRSVNPNEYWCFRLGYPGFDPEPNVIQLVVAMP